MILAFTLAIAVKYSPLPPDNKPIKEVERLLILKALSVVFIILWSAVVKNWPVNMALASAYALLWQSISLTPFGQNICAILDGVLAKVFFWEGGEIL